MKDKFFAILLYKKGIRERQGTLNTKQIAEKIAEIIDDQSQSSVMHSLAVILAHFSREYEQPDDAIDQICEEAKCFSKQKRKE